jgi:GT2 family glycosyltransferase
VRVVADRNVGFGGGNNRAAALARGGWLVFLNPDTMVEPGWLDALLESLGDGPALATAKIVLADDPKRIDTCANQVHLSGITVCRGYGRSSDAYPDRERVLAVSGATFAVDRDTFERLGGFDERFFMYLEDTDLSLRAALLGVPIWFVPSSRVRHRHVATFGPRKLRWLERNRYLMLAKIWSRRTLVTLLPTLLLVELMTWCYALLGGTDAVRAKAGAWTWLLTHPWTVLAGRRETQRARRVSDQALLALCERQLDFAELIGSPTLRALADALAAPLLALAAATVSRGTRHAPESASRR